MVVDLSNLPQDVLEAFHTLQQQGMQEELLAAIARQKQIAEHYHRNPPRWREGIGAQVMAMDPFIDAMAARQFGPEWDTNPDLKDWVRRRHEEFRVKSVSGKVMVGWAPQAEGRRFHKNYG